uniref:Uncharacterized protein n=1 Tax=Timema tahoe TaxID=61484 RepID=A0A7R9NUP4_9NEOP|nr:unnamed protein product [Timema tahoe]
MLTLIFKLNSPRFSNNLPSFIALPSSLYVTVLGISPLRSRLIAKWFICVVPPSQYGPGSPRYEVRWAIPEEYTELQVLPRMILDHLPENVDHAIATLLQEQDMPTHISP